MSRGSIFDPEGWGTEHSGNRYMGPSAENISHLPPDVVDGKVDEEEDEESEDLDALAAAREEAEREREDRQDKTNPDSDI